MKRILWSLVLLLLPSLGLARGDSGHMGSFAIGGFYGLASVSPGDINGLAQQIGSTPPVGGINSDLYYGATIDFMLSHRMNLKIAYDWHDAKDFTSTNLNSNTGFEITQNDVWGILDFYLVRNNSVYAYLGAGVGYPTLSHLTQTTSSTTQRDADKVVGYEGDAGIGVMLGGHISLFFEGGYQKLTSGTVKDSAGNRLNNTAGNAAVLDLSGLRANAGLKFHF